MTSIEELRQQARTGNLHALQELRDRGFFQGRPSADGYPVSHAQRQIWTINQMAGAASAFNIPIALELTGALNVAALRNALGTIIRRHESLRTRFVPSGGSVRQFISDDVPLPWAEQDLSDDADAPGQVRRIAAEDAARHFDLAAGRPLRATLLRIAPDRHVLLFNIHHIVADLITLGIVLHEFSACYAAAVAGRAAGLEPLPIQYRDFAARQRSWLAGDDAARHLAYWRRRLAGPLSPLDVPADFVRPPLRNHAGAIERVAVGAELTQALRRVGLRHGMTLFMVLVATVKLLLYRYTGQEDIVIGYPTSGRDSPDLAGQVGCFVNMVALRSRLGATDSFDALLDQVRHNVLEAFEHQAYPFDLLVEELGLARDLSRSPVFDVSASLVNAERGEFRFGDVAVAPIDNGYVGAKLDLAFDFHEAEDGLELAIGYSTDLFGAERIRRMAAHYRHLVTHAIEHPDQPIGRLSLMAAEERHLVLDAFNATDRPPPGDAPGGFTVVELFQQHAARAPDAPAVSFGDQLLCYGALNRQANRLAHLLAASGIGPDCMVGVHLDTSIETVVGFLAILKARGVYLPLDPSNPSERLTAMLDDARPVAILTRPDMADRLSIPLECRLLFWDDELRSQLAEYPDDDPPRAAAPLDAAYAIYTSGSTGQPKAAVLLHRGLANVVREQARQFAPLPGDRILQFSALGFDASIFEMVMALGCGATLCLAEREHLLGAALARTLERAAITMAVLPPSTLAALPDTELPMLRVLMAAGETCSADLVRRWALGRAFHNLYGPTEATIWASGMRCAAGAGAPTIGRPIGNTRLFILDRLLQPLPIGIPGELCIAGIGLARHYLNRPELTAERFIAAPFDGVPDGRLYRTGDMARWRADGTMEFLGRADVQVKLRGYRIEPGEVEVALAGHPAIRDAVVVARDGAVGQQLVAYVTQRSGDAPVGEAALRQYLRGRLPDYMVPARVILLDAMPLTPNRKVDRRALPDPDATHRDRARHYVAPRDDLEHALADLFADALRIERVGATDSLFDLGADSLNATRIVAQLHDAFRIDVSIPQLFQSATARALGDFLRAGLPAGHADRIASALRRLRTMSPHEKAALLARRRG